MKKILAFLAGTLCAICFMVSVRAEDDMVVNISNNVKTSSIIEVIGAEAKSIVEAYNTSGMLLARKKVSSSSNTVELKTKKLDPDGGVLSVRVTLPSGEVTSLSVSYEPQPITDADLLDQVTINNNVDKRSTIVISGLEPKDFVQVFAAVDSGQKLYSGRVGSNKDEVTISVPKNKLSGDGGALYFSITRNGMRESQRIPITYDPQPESDMLLLDNVEILNNVSKKGSVIVSELEPKDVVTLYNADGKKIASKKVSSSKSEVTFSTSQLSKAGGKVNITLKKPDERESEPLEAKYDPKEITPILAEKAIVFSNAPNGGSDTVYVDGLEPGDVIKVYKGDTTSVIFAKGTVKSSANDVTIDTTFSKDGGEYWVSNTRSNMLESDRIKVECSKEEYSLEIPLGNIKVTNNSGIPSEIYVRNLVEKTTVKVWKTVYGVTLLASGEVEEGKTELSISLTQLSQNGGSVWLSRIEPDANESPRVEVQYDGEETSKFDENFDVHVAINVGAADTITVSGLNPKDVIKAYNKPGSGSVLASGTVGDYASSVTFTVSQLGSVGGEVYLTRTELGRVESPRIAFPYAAEGVSDKLDIASNGIEVANNSGIASTLTVSSLYSEDVIQVYDAQSNGNVIGKDTVAAFGNSVVVSLSSLNVNGGELWVSRTTKGLNESERLKVDYKKLQTSDAPELSNITIVNNAGIASTIKVECLNSGDIVKVYNSSGSVLGTATADAIGGSVTISIAQLSSSGGSIEITVTSLGKGESKKTEATYDAHKRSDAPTNVTVTNNSDIPDVIKVDSLLTGDEVKVYRTESDTSALVSATASAGQTSVSLSVSSLGADKGSLYISVKSIGKTESQRTKVDYEAESVAPKVGDVVITNNVDIASIIVVSKVTAGDVIKVYDTATASLPKVSAIASGDVVHIQVSQLTSGAGTLYLSITSYGRTESSRTAVSYSAQEATNIVGSQISISRDDDSDSYVVNISGLLKNDYVRIYNADTSNATLLGSATATSDKVSIKLSQTLGSGVSLYISVTSSGKLESKRLTISTPW